MILSLLVQVFERGESLQTAREVVGVEGENPMADSRRDAPVLFRESFAVFMGVDGVVAAPGITGTAVGCALKNRCEYCESSASWTATTAAPATYAKMLPFGRLSNPVGELTVVPMILFNERPASYRGRHLFGERGVRGYGYGELFGVSLIPRPLLAAIVRGFEGVNNIFQPCAVAQSNGRLFSDGCS